jgi:hypothetical protein
MTITPADPANLTTRSGIPRTLRAYPYWQYSDDDVIQAYFTAYNQITQYYLEWFNDINLPIYTLDIIEGDLLDWVANGIYHYPRPTIPGPETFDQGPWDTFVYNLDNTWNELTAGPRDWFVVNDDVYKRCLTWHFFKGDGKVFNVRWLKRRIMRWLLGENGTAPEIEETYQISVTFGLNNVINIRFLSELKMAGIGPWNTFVYNDDDITWNEVNVTTTSLTPLPDIELFKLVVESGCLELPFQYTAIVVID